MKIPKYIEDKIFNYKKTNEKAKAIEKEIFQWFESKGIDTFSNGFTDVVGSYISYGEFDSIEDIQNYLDDYIDGRRE